MSGHGGSGGTKTTKSSPWSGQAPYLTDLFKQAQGLYNAPGPNYFPGQTFAGFNPTQIGAQGSALGAAHSLQPTIDQGLSTSRFLTDPRLLNPNSNPALAAAAMGAARPTVQTLMDTILPRINNQAMRAGNLGNDRQGIAQGLAIRGTEQAIADQSAKIYANAYGQGLHTMTQNLALQPTLDRTALLPAQIESGIGAQQQQMTQQGINEAVARYNYQQQLPYQKLSQYSQIINRLNGGGYGTTVNQAHQNHLTAGLEGALGGAALGAKAGMFFGPEGALIGGGLGAVGGGLMGAF